MSRRPAPGSPTGSTPRRGPAAVTAVAAAAGVWASHTVFRGTATGRDLEAAALAGAEAGPAELGEVAGRVLEVVSVPFVIAVVIAAVVSAALRRRPMVAWQVVLVMVGANLTTQFLKRYVFDVPGVDLAGRPYDSLPSGHTTVAAAVATCLVLVVPVRARPVAALLGAAYTGVTGVSTLVGGWHRPSDVVAAVLVVLSWACVAMLVASTSPVPTYDAVVEAGGRVPGARGTVVATWVLGGGAVVAAAVAAIATASALGSPATIDPGAAYLAGTAGIVAAAAVGLLAVLRTLRITEPVHLHR